MSNYENIKPYAEFAHTAAQHGGIDTYLKQIADENYDLGVMDERKNNVWKILVIGIAIWEGGKWLYKKGCKFYEFRRQEKIMQSEAAKEAIKQRVKLATEIPPENSSVYTELEE